MRLHSIKFFGTESSQLSTNMVSQITQVTESLHEATGIDINTVLAGFLGGKIAQERHPEKDSPVTSLIAPSPATTSAESSTKE